MKCLFHVLGFLGWAASLSAAPTTLRSWGAVGDGVTDNRAILEKALKESAGAPLDGEGLTYAVHGTISVAVDVDLKNVSLKQTAGSWDTSPYIRSAASTETPKVLPEEALTKMLHGRPWLRHDGVASYLEDPVVSGQDLEALRAMLNLRTLFIRGHENKKVSVRLENIQILRGNHPDAGMHSNSAGLYLVAASPLILKNVEITGAGKGSGLLIHGCQKVRMDAVHIHDIRWAPYRGDVAYDAATLSEFGWNNSPIYDFDSRQGRFVRVRVQEQLTGMTLTNSEDVEISHTNIECIGTEVEGKFVPWQADGMTISGVKNLIIRDCVINQVWEGIDFTGRGVDGFLQENIRIHDTFAYGFKYAHPQNNGKVIRCVSERAGFKSFIIGSESSNIEFVKCEALETGVNSHWRKPGRAKNGIAGFDLNFDQEHSPKNITLKDCKALNEKFPGEMETGFLTSDRARNPEHGIKLIQPQVSGAKLRDIDGFSVSEK